MKRIKKLQDDKTIEVKTVDQEIVFCIMFLLISSVLILLFLFIDYIIVYTKRIGSHWSLFMCYIRMYLNVL